MTEKGNKANPDRASESHSNFILGIVTDGCSVYIRKPILVLNRNISLQPLNIPLSFLERCIIPLSAASPGLWRIAGMREEVEREREGGLTWGRGAAGDGEKVRGERRGSRR